MNVYHVATICLFIFALFCPYYKSFGRNVVFFIASMIPMGLLCLRPPYVGVDSIYSYYPAFLDSQLMPWEMLLSMYSWEPGYLFFDMVLGRMVGKVELDTYRFIMGGIIFIPILFYLKRYSKDPALSLFIVFATGLFYFSDAYRSSMALMVSLISHQYIIRRKWIHFLLILAVASLFHRSILVLLIVYPMFNIKINHLGILFSAVISMMLCFFGDKCIYLFNLFARIPMKAQWRGGGGMIIFMWAVLAMVYLLAHQHLKCQRFKLWFVMLWIAVITHPLCYMDSVWERAQYFFLVSIWTLLPETISWASRKEHHKKFLWAFRAMVLLLLCAQAYAYYDAKGIHGRWILGA